MQIPSRIDYVGVGMDADGVVGGVGREVEGAAQSADECFAAGLNHDRGNVAFSSDVDCLGEALSERFVAFVVPRSMRVEKNSMIFQHAMGVSEVGFPRGGRVARIKRIQQVGRAVEGGRFDHGNEPVQRGVEGDNFAVDAQLTGGGQLADDDGGGFEAGVPAAQYSGPSKPLEGFDVDERVEFGDNGFPLGGGPVDLVFAPPASIGHAGFGVLAPLVAAFGGIGGVVDAGNREAVAGVDPRLEAGVHRQGGLFFIS